MCKTKSINISIVVPVKNGMDTLERFIKGIQVQSILKDIEVVIIDSGSNDGSLEYLEAFEFVKVISIDPKTFNHGATRNFAITQCQGEFVFMTVQDAWTTDEHLLKRMLTHFDDIEVMGVCGQQIVPKRDDTNPHEWFRPYSKPKPKVIQFKDSEEFINLGEKEQFKYCGWDDVIAMYRKTALQQLPFETVAFGEDMLWAKAALIKGYRIVYDYRNRVNHYHHEYPDFVYKRTFIVLYFIYKSFGFVRDLSVPKSEFLKIIYRNLKYKVNLKWIIFNWKARDARHSAFIDFNKALKVSEENLDKVYSKVCSNVPQGKSYKKIINTKFKLLKL
ncbi:glycosyltransferase family 2 protein [Formosa algae]|uniref:Rhamnosyltransferase n=1 Tax=Formosa algae TaxID=225843 RepID=A0A9X0YHR3_9FLAO|nr:glycosyltransferase family 2 protein [Formosa algae]MBP1839115.1 rhamnosyltransferase [Formosa algae]MDQ0333892.1 rhamnosyltransferase [Formosa algae]OEI79317.1 hypothetical protein AST99_15205 [Formosa algae]